MCGVCGCSNPGTGGHAQHHHGHHHHDHGDGHPHHHDHHHDTGTSAHRLLRMEEDLLASNNHQAAHNRTLCREKGWFMVNLLSSPGSGKTTLLVATLQALAGRHAVGVIEGDQQTDLDAQRIRATGTPAIQINTGKLCHLDAPLVAGALDQLALPAGGMVLVENIGNLVCPAAFDLGEALKVVLLSVTEGEDKPLKYPDIFAQAHMMLLTKADLLPHVSFDVARCLVHARQVNPGIASLVLSASSGNGMAAWLDYLQQHYAAFATNAAAQPRARACP
jgi:hydrogenase nickel incorporation protein HypB